jgi:hypothetical protein
MVTSVEYATRGFFASVLGRARRPDATKTQIRSPFIESEVRRNWYPDHHKKYGLSQVW